MIVTSTQCLLLKDRHTFLKENWDWTCHFSGKQLATWCLRPDCQKRILFWSKTLKIRACFRKKVKDSGPVLDFWKWRIDPDWWHMPVYPSSGSFTPQPEFWGRWVSKKTEELLFYPGITEFPWILSICPTTFIKLLLWKHCCFICTISTQKSVKASEFWEDFCSNCFSLWKLRISYI